MPQSPPLPSRFVVDRALGVGPSAKTYLVHDRVLDRAVVIKTVDIAGTNAAGAAARFEREAQAAAAVNHPNVVGVFDFGSFAGTRYLVLRYVEGETLREYLARRGPLSADEAVRIVGQVLDGLGAIHAAGLVHRDVKPENIIVGRDGLLRITDFGIAVAPTDGRLTMQGLVWGTPAYMAPEQALGFGVSAATDLYAAGVILFELLTGRPPFAFPTSPAGASARVAASPPATRDVAAEIGASPALKAVVRRALAKNPDDRFRTAREMADALAALPSLVDEAETAPTAPPLQPEPPRPVSVPLLRRNEQPTAVLPTAPPFVRMRRPAPWLAVVLPLLIVGVVATVIGGAAASGVWGGGDDAPPRATAGQSAETSADSQSGQAFLISHDTPTAHPVPTASPTTTSTPVAPTSTARVQAAAIATKPPTQATKPAPTATVALPTATKKPRSKKTQSTGTPTPAPTEAPVRIVSAAPVSRTFRAGDWQGAFAGDQSWYGRPWVAIYGAQSGYPQATIGFSLGAAPAGQATLALDGLDDEWAGNASIEVRVNGVAIFTGPSPFQSWTNEGHGENANWTTAALTIPAGTLHAGANQITVANTEPAANFGTGPYVLLSGVLLTIPGTP